MKVIIYALDSLRPDHLFCYGYPDDTSPNIDALARDGVLFENAFAPSTWTRPSAASLLTGMYPRALGVETIHDYFVTPTPRLPEMFKALSCNTLAISAIPQVSTYFGFAKGFDVFVDLYRERLPECRMVWSVDSALLPGHAKPPSLVIPTAEDINSYAFPLLSELRQEDFFMLIWSMDTHNPYFLRGDTDRFKATGDQEVLAHRKIVRIRSPAQRRQLIELYDRMIYFNDWHIGHLVDQLHALGIYNDTALLITADHGEAFGEHGENSHAGVPYDEQIRVPLILKLPGSKFAGQRVGSLVQLVDVAPTLLDLVDSPIEQTWQGRSLLPEIRGDERCEAPIFSSNHFHTELGSYNAIRTRKWKYVAYDPPRISPGLLKSKPRMLGRIARHWLSEPRERLFELDKDAKEMRNLARGHRAICRRLEQRLAHWRHENDQKKEAAGQTSFQIDQDVEQRLRALGYID